MSKRFYIIYQIVLIVLTVVAVLFGVINVIRYSGAIITKGTIWTSVEMIICFTLFILVLIGYGVMLLISHFVGEKLED